MMAAESVTNLVFSGPLQWAEESACRGESRLFFAPAGERPEARATREAQARAVCRSCEALVDCRAWAREIVRRVSGTPGIAPAVGISAVRTSAASARTASAAPVVCVSRASASP